MAEEKKDKRSETSSQNGKLGGRPVSEATIRTQAARDYISKAVEDSLGAIVAKAITQAIEGNADARNWLSNYAWGKPVQAVVSKDDEGNEVPFTGINILPLNGDTTKGKNS